MDCEHIKELLLSYIDDEIDDDERKLVEVHLSDCAECTAEMEALAVAGSRLRQAYETVAAGVSPSAGVWQAIKNRIDTKQPTGERDTDWTRSRWGWLFGWRRPVWRTAVAGAAMLSFMIVFAINNAPAQQWTAAEQQAIDIAVNDSVLQALLGGEGVVYEVIPVNGDEESQYYQVAFLNYDSSDMREGLKTNAFSGSNQTDGPSSVYSESDSYGAVPCIVTGGTEDGVDAVDSVKIPLSVQSNGSVIVEIRENSVVGYTLNSDNLDFCLSSNTVQEAALIAHGDPRIGTELTVESVSLLNDYDIDEGIFTDEMVIWVRLSDSDGDSIYFAQVDLEEQKVVKLVEGGE